MDSRIAPWASPARARPARRASRPSCRPTRRRRSHGRPRRRARTPAGSTTSACSSTPARTCRARSSTGLHEALLARSRAWAIRATSTRPGSSRSTSSRSRPRAAVARVMRAALRRGPPDQRDAREPRGLHGARAARRHDRGAARLGGRPPQPPRDRRARRARPARRAAALPRLDVDLDALEAFLARERPVLVVVGASLMLFPHRLREIAALVAVPLLYDASHVAGLIAEGRFQDPLAEGADLVTFSTYKSFGGPPGGAIVTNDAALAEAVATAVYPGPDRELRRLAARPAGRRGARARALRGRLRRPVHRQRPRARGRARRRGLRRGSARSGASPPPTTSRSRARRRRRRPPPRRGQHPPERDRHPGRRRPAPRHSGDHAPGLHRGRHAGDRRALHRGPAPTASARTWPGSAAT